MPVRYHTHKTQVAWQATDTNNKKRMFVKIALWGFIINVSK